MRLVSLCPSLTELVFALGRGADLVGITRFCVRPGGAVDAIEKVGGTKNPKVARIAELAPDLVLLNEEENRLDDARALAAAGLDCHASFPRTPEEAAATVREIGARLDRAERAEAIARRIERRLARLRSRTAGLPPVSFAYLVWRDPWMAAGAGTYPHSLLAAAGGTNVFAGRGERYPVVTLDELASASPRRLLLASEPYPFGDAHREELAAAGLAPGRVLKVDGELLNWHGPRTPEALGYAATLLRDAPADS